MSSFMYKKTASKEFFTDHNAEKILFYRRVSAFPVHEQYFKILLVVYTFCKHFLKQPATH